MSHYDAKEAIGRSGKQKRPFYLTGAALALIAVGILNLAALSLFVFLPIFHHYIRSTAWVPLLIGLWTFVSATLVASGIGVIRGSGWSRLLAIPCLLLLCVQAGWPVLFGHGRITGFGWTKLVVYLCISVFLVTRGASEFFNAPRART